jgi:hypothetical protein
MGNVNTLQTTFGQYELTPHNTVIDFFRTDPNNECTDFNRYGWCYYEKVAPLSGKLNLKMYGTTYDTGSNKDIQWAQNGGIALEYEMDGGDKIQIEVSAIHYIQEGQHYSDFPLGGISLSFLFPDLEDTPDEE